MIRLAALLAGLQVAAAVQLSVSPGAGLTQTAYDKLSAVLAQRLEGIADGKRLCVGHSADGTDAVLKAATAGSCDAGVVALGAAPSLESHSGIPARLLVVAGDVDGFVPFSHFAAAMHRSQTVEGRHFAVLHGASHMSFASGQPSQAVASVDLQAEVSEDVAHARIADIVKDFVQGGGAALAAAERDAIALSTPVIASLKLEGSTQLGHPSCNSDWPTNPTCQYPKFPDHSTPFGPAPAPSPPLPSDCVCGSKWVEDYAIPIAHKLPAGSVTSKDAFHLMSDTHPFHLPHIFNKCDKPSEDCILNETTVTEPLAKSGDLWPQSATSQPLSVLELRTKIKSIEALYTNAGVPGASSDLDKTTTLCKSINQAAYDWALSNAESSVLQRFKTKGEPLKMVDDMEATIGITGPEWIKDELVYKRVKDSTSATGTTVEVQSWKFVVGNTNKGNVPWFFPVGMHYCKLLSPARAMEWIYTDSMRKMSVKSKSETIVV